MEVDFSPFSLLPNEVIDLILLYSGERTGKGVFNLALVCKAWSHAPVLIITKLDLREILNFRTSNITKLVNVNNIKANHVAFLVFNLEHFSKLTSLNLERSMGNISSKISYLTNLTCLKTSRGINASELPQLTKLRITTNYGLDTIHFHTNLTWLDISVCYVRRVNISHLTNLVLLKANACTIRNEHIKFMTNLTALDLSLRNDCTEQANLTTISHLCKLTSLCLDSNPSIRDEQLTCLTNLTVLSLVGNMVITRDALLPLTNLTVLNLWKSQIVLKFTPKKLKWLKLSSGDIIKI